jgi:phosphoglycolate phosphatase
MSPAGGERKGTIPLPLIAFDFDGVLADSIEHNLTVTNRVCQRLGHRRVFTAADIAGLTRMDFSELGAMIGLRGQEWEKVRDTILDGLADGIEAVAPFPGVIPALRGLRGAGARLAIVSANASAVVGAFLRQNGIEDWFDDILTSDNPGTKAEKLSRLLSSSGLPPDMVFMVGDAVSDIQAAKDAGLQAVGVAWGFQPPERLAAAGADLLLDRPEALSALANPRERGQ